VTEIGKFVASIDGPHERASYDGSTDSSEARAKRLDVIAKASFNNLRTYGNCCRSTLWALQTHLDLPSEDLLKASTTLAGGIAGTGETCGAVIGALMGIGIALGSADLGDLLSRQTARTAAGLFVQRFTEMFGSTRCYGVQEATVGWCCDDPSLTEKWHAANGPIACAAACAEAARMAANLVLDEIDPA